MARSSLKTAKSTVNGRRTMRVINLDGGGVRLLRIPTCAWCESPLVDEHGNPAWDLFDADLTFVCRNGCAAP